uniref:SAS-6_N domain-containing protein n=1 Tax=Strongyloides stercoralis TaxID=6248 RepID=A0A0K0ERA8_STRER
MEVLFNSPVSVKIASSSEGVFQKRRALYNIKVLIKNAAIDKEFIVELSDDQKPSFIFTVTLTRESYLVLQKEQRLEADFDQCIKIVVDFLRSLVPENVSINENNSNSKGKYLKGNDEEQFIKVSFEENDKKLTIELMSKSTLKALSLLSLTMNALSGEDLVYHLERKMQVKVQTLEHKLSETIKKNDEKKKDLESIMERLKKKNSTLENELEDARKERSELKNNINDKESEIRVIQRDLDMLKSEREIDLSQLDNLTDELNQCRDQIYELEDILKDKDDEIDDLKERIDLIEKERDTLILENTRLRERCSQLKADHSKANEILGKFMSEHNKERNSISSLTKEIEKFKLESAKYSEDIKIKTKKITELEKINSEQKAKIKLLESRCEKFQDMVVPKRKSNILVDNISVNHPDKVLSDRKYNTNPNLH